MFFIPRKVNVDEWFRGLRIAPVRSAPTRIALPVPLLKVPDGLAYYGSIRKVQIVRGVYDSGSPPSPVVGRASATDDFDSPTTSVATNTAGFVEQDKAVRQPPGGAIFPGQSSGEVRARRTC